MDTPRPPQALAAGEARGDLARVDAEKKALRAQVRERLRGLGPCTEGESRAAQERLLASGALDGLACVALYRALPGELETELVEAALRGRGVLVCLPRIRTAPYDLVGMPTISAHEQRALELCAADGALARGPLGIAEPHPDRPAIPLARIDAFVVPGLAADLQGNRLGRGRAHYDATLAAHPRALRIGLFREAALVPRVPVSEHDQQLDALCTEARWLVCPMRPR